jgi:hypothetical protein
LTARAPVDAARVLRSQYQRLLSSVTNAVVLLSGAAARAPAPLYALELSGSPVRLRGERDVLLGMRVRCRAVSDAERPRDWTAVLAAYEFGLYTADDRELLLYHWHPDAGSSMVTPHLHLGSGAAPGGRDLSTAHLPTGMIVLPDFLRFAIAELGVRPLRADWSAVLASADAARGE